MGISFPVPGFVSSAVLLLLLQLQLLTALLFSDIQHLKVQNLFLKGLVRSGEATVARQLRILAVLAVSGLEISSNTQVDTSQLPITLGPDLMPFSGFCIYLL